MSTKDRNLVRKWNAIMADFFEFHAYCEHYGSFPYGIGSMDPKLLRKNKPWPLKKKV